MKTYRLIDIDDGFHCSIVGTCLSLEEVRKLLERCMGKDLSELSDYDLHRMALEEVRVYSRFSNKITEKLNSKYRADIFRASKLTKESELLGYWTRSFDDGLIAGPYWALLSHPGCTSFAANKAFGQVHMLSHLAGASYRVSLRELHSKEVRIKEMEAESSESLSRVFKISRELDHYKNICKTLKEELDCKEKRLKKMEDTIVSLSREPENQTQSRKEMESVLKRNETLEEKLYYMTEELFFAQEQLEILKNEKSRDPLCLCDDSCGYSLPADLKDRKVLLVGGAGFHGAPLQGHDRRDEREIPAS